MAQLKNYHPHQARKGSFCLERIRARTQTRIDATNNKAATSVCRGCLMPSTRGHNNILVKNLAVSCREMKAAMGGECR